MGKNAATAFDGQPAGLFSLGATITLAVPIIAVPIAPAIVGSAFVVAAAVSVPVTVVAFTVAAAIVATASVAAAVAATVIAVTVIGLSAAAGRTRSGGNQGILELGGRNRYVSVFASHALKRSRKFNLWLNGEIDYLAVEQSQDRLVFQDDRIVTASVGFAGNYDVGVGRIYGGVGITQGLGILGASKSGDPLNSRLNGSGEFTKVNLWVNSIFNAGGGFGVRFAANAQIASRPLLAPNEIAIGGPYFGRGYDFSERFGDEGVLGLTELRKEFNGLNDWLDWFQLYGFLDGGYVDNIGSGYGDGSLASAGGGMRAQIGGLDLGLEVGAPINDDRFESGDQSPKVNMQVGLRF